jgi:hypothetical protein
VHETGLIFLDYSHLDVAEGGGQYPPWTVGEIRALAREWKKAEPIWKRVKTLIDYIDARPGERLVQLAGIICGDREARIETCVRRYRGRRLVEVFSGVNE